ncbi:hypothetical protein PV326_005154 [Microctonus aethiopoides]|nr:hypothetical protein PV326_005154 [Microctonus aethiopoides]
MASTSFILPENMRPFPKAGPRLEKKRNTRKRRKSESEEDETFGLECTESYSSSVSEEEWVQCITCKLWAHTKCANGNILFCECKNCTSDLED